MDIKSISKISLNDSEKWNKKCEISETYLNDAINKAIEQVDKNMTFFGEGFQSPSTFNNKYKKMDNVDWTNGFWTGVLWLSFELKKDEKYKALALKNVESFLDRINKKIVVDHHDMGFLYSLSCVSAWKIDKSKDGKKAALLAADQLLKRFQEKGNFIQAWGANGDDDNYRLIIDAMLNVPLLYWASEETENEEMASKALKHFETSINTTIRNDGTTHHTYFFDKEGKPLCGKTKQGFSDDSCWARGQAWVIYGIPLSIKYNPELKGNSNLIEMHKSLSNYFLNYSSKDDVVFWDLIFKEGDGESKDSSASAIAACGLLEMSKYLKDDKQISLYVNAAKIIAKSLIDNYNNKIIEEGRPILLHGVYSYHSTRGNNGIDEGNIWGDYFYLELLTRLKKDWKIYW